MRSKKEVTKERISKDWSEEREREKQGEKNFSLVVQENSDNKDGRFRKGCLP